MADQRLSDDEVQLRQKARQRLIGAVTLMMAAVVVLPWALDGKPRTHANEIAVYLPASGAAGGRAAVAPAPLPVRPANSAAAGSSAAATPAPAPPGAAAAAPGAAAPSGAMAAAPGETSQADRAAASAPAAAVSAPRVRKPAAALAEAPAAAPAASRREAVHAQKPASQAPSAHSGPDDSMTRSESRAARETAAADTPANPPAVQGFVLQLGTFSQADNARQLKARLTAKGVPVFTERLASPGGDRIRVRVGPYPSRAAAEKALSQVNALGLSGVVLNAR